MYVGPDPVADIAYYAEAQRADTPRLNALWKAASSAPSGPTRELRLALLASLPNHAHADPARAAARLRVLIDADPPAPIAALARARLFELQSREATLSQCRAEASSLRKRLDAVVDIERTLDGAQD